jgi:hypothetical protein
MAAVESARRLCAYPGCGRAVRGKRSDAKTCSDKHRVALRRLPPVFEVVGDPDVFVELALLDPAHYGRLIELVRSDAALGVLERKAA